MENTIFYKEEVNIKDRRWACLMYLASAVYIFPLSIYLIPLIIWIFHKDSSNFINRHAKNIFNANLNLIMYLVIFLIAIIAIAGLSGEFINFTKNLQLYEKYDSAFFLALVGQSNMAPLLTLVVVFLLLYLIYFGSFIAGAVKSYKGKEFKFPLIVSFVK